METLAEYWSRFSTWARRHRREPSHVGALLGVIGPLAGAISLASWGIEGVWWCIVLSVALGSWIGQRGEG